VDKATFKELLTVCSSNVVMQTNDGYFFQTDGLAMGSPPAPQIANGWMSKFDARIKDNASLYNRYMDDILRNIDRNSVQDKLAEINNLHPCLKFTLEEETDQTIAFLDMKIARTGNTLNSTWYQKPTDTGLTMNYHSLAPVKYKRSVISGLVHRIFRACSTWRAVHESLWKAKEMLLKNQYPPSFFNPIIEKTLNAIIISTKIEENDPPEKSEEKEEEEQREEERKLVFVEYRGRASEKLENSLKKLQVPCKVVFTIRKLKTVLPSLKPTIDVSLRSKVVYKIECPCCNACYVGQTGRHLIYRIKEHQRKNSPVGAHFAACNVDLCMKNVKVIASTHKSLNYLMTLEALFINEIKPSMNTKDEYRSRALVIKL
jgi:hypothetical protein